MWDCQDTIVFVSKFSKRLDHEVDTTHFVFLINAEELNTESARYPQDNFLLLGFFRFHNRGHKGLVRLGNLGNEMLLACGTTHFTSPKLNFSVRVDPTDL